MKFFACILLVFVSNKLFSQAVISGKIFNEQNEIIFNANVVISNPNQSQIIAYAITNNIGAFEIKCSKSLDSLEIKVTMIGYATQTKIIQNKSQVLNFVLTEKKIELPMVTVQKKPITINGDTTSYNVATFTNKQNRVIGDIIAKLPGIEMDANGQIKYNGKFISNYYIDGLDLLESRYNIANQNIPLNIVDEVQILNNHQPVKMLDSLNSSNTPALNIKLKISAKNKLIGKAKLGAGIMPLLWDNELTALQFSPKIQLISAYKNNNSGTILSNELSNNISIGRVGDVAEQNTKENILSSITPTKPAISENKYLFNESHLAHLNTLRLLKNKAQLKLNVSYLNDYKKTESVINTTFFLPADTFLLAEKQKYTVNTNQLNGSLDYNINKEKFYFKNTTKGNVEYSKENNNIVNTSSVSQTLNNPFYQYSNNLALSFSRRKKIYSIASTINYNLMPQSLEVEPGQFLSIFNQNIPYLQLQQYASLNNFNSNNSIAFLTKTGKLKQQIKIGTEYINKSIQTSIYKTYNQVKYELNDSFQNKLNWQNTRLYAEARSTIKKGKSELEITIPIELNSLSINNRTNRFKENTSNVFFNPQLNLDVPITSEMTMQLGYNKVNSIGSPSQITQGFILNTYRSINQNDSLIPKQKRNIYSFSLYYKDPLKALFGYLTATYVATNKNLINTQVYDTFYTKNISLQQKNIQKSFLLMGNISKYVIPARTNIVLSYDYNYIEIPQYLQGRLVNLNYSANRFQLKVNFAKLSWFNAETNTVFDISKSKIKSPGFTSSVSPVNKIQQNLKLYFYPTKNIALFFNNDLYNISDKETTNSNYIFSDVGIKIKLKKSDLELACTNIANTKSYTSIVFNRNQVQTIMQDVRPLNFMVRYWFNF